MPSAFVAILLLAAQPSTGCGEPVRLLPPVEAWDDFKSGTAYHKRLYYGHFDRHPFDYRFQFDYPWHAGPSQPQWPIAPLPPAGMDAWHAIEFEAHRASNSSRRVSIASQSAGPAESASRTTLKLRAPVASQR